MPYTLDIVPHDPIADKGRKSRRSIPLTQVRSRSTSLPGIEESGADIAHEQVEGVDGLSRSVYEFVVSDLETALERQADPEYLTHDRVEHVVRKMFSFAVVAQPDCRDDELS